MSHLFSTALEKLICLSQTGKALGTSFMGQSRVVADGLIKHKVNCTSPSKWYSKLIPKVSKWVFKSTRRGHIIRLSGAEPNSFVCMEGRRPPREGGRLLTLSYSQTWRLEAVEGDAESTIFRYADPAVLFAFIDMPNGASAQDILAR